MVAEIIKAFFFYFLSVLFARWIIRVTTILGYLPQELSGTSVYEYYHIDDIPQMAERHKEGKSTPSPRDGEERER